MHNPQHINPARTLVNHVEDAVVTNSEEVGGFRKFSEAINPETAVPSQIHP
jgi:hypothetical protein